MTGFEGHLSIVDISRLKFLPRPNNTTEFNKTYTEWGSTSAKVEDFIKKNFMTYKHREQIDIFQDKIPNYLHYNEDGKFTHAIPRSVNQDGRNTATLREVPVLYVRKEEKTTSLEEDEDDD